MQDVVNTAIYRCLNDRRKWTENAPDDLEMFLRGVIKSIVSSAKKSAVRDRATATADAGAETAAEKPMPDEILAERGSSEILSAAAACVEGDDDLEMLYLAILTGTSNREELANVLGWPVARVSAGRIKLQRRLVTRFPEVFASYKKKRASA